ncbi:uncharacterized protein LOC117271076 [Epinephelus lanceolatus]|uniref:uncharacterized protein LOC117271076 isoform X1 n=2 Tax=Epinephelus lanceolatus TaxID=310571 RepID=UPI0014456FCB|nr:uncharacterized protein LOC117271076 isoform X1 [Epinephelus lanceolatus]
MKTAAFIIGFVFICCDFTEQTTAEGFVDAAVRSECRDRYLWIQVTSVQTPRFEAVDENGVYSISKQLASRCGYTISTFKMDGFTTFRASYYSCFTHNQDDEVFTFRFNVMVSDAGGSWISRPVSAVCSGLSWTHREVICEEDYMEVNVNRESSCGGQRGDSGDMWQAAFSQAQRAASSVWQLMFLQRDGQASSMSISEAQGWGYSLTTTARRVVLRSQYKPPHAELIMVDGVPVEVVQASLFFKQKLTVMMIDVSMACTVNSGSFDGARLLWDVPRVVTPLVGEGAGFESKGLSVGVEGVLLDEVTAATRGFSLVQQGHLVQIGVPFGAEGGYRKSLVVNNMYKETYVIFLLYEHIFSLLYEDGSSVDTRHRMVRVLDTPLLCRPTFHLDHTVSDDHVFSVYLGNIPADVMLEEVRVNGKQLMMSESTGRGYSVTPVVHINGSRAYELRLPFEDSVVHWMNLGQGVVQYSIDINFTLTIMPQRDSYYHHTVITARVLNTFPPEITAQCSDGGITFSVVRPPRAESLWEVGVDHEPLTSQLAAQRGYRLHSDTHKTTLEVPVFSIGYTYEDINLSNFYGTFKLLLRDSKTLEVQTSTSKRCLFKTEDMIVCSADGTMTVVTTPTSTWPTVKPTATTLLDPTCGPKETDRSKVLFEFKLDSCGTRAMVGESYMVYENEILHDRQLIADGPNFISRESQFKLTVRCFYPLNGVNRLSVDRIFRSETPGFGSVKVFKSLKGSAHLPDKDCSHQVAGNAVNTPTNQAYQTYQTPAAGGVLPNSGIRPRPKPGPSHFITIPGGHNKPLYSSQNLQSFPSFNLPPSEGQTTGTHQVPLQASSLPGPLMFQTQDQHVFKSQTDGHLPNVPPRYDPLPDDSIQLSNLNTLSFNYVRREKLTDENPAGGLSSSSRIPDSPVMEPLESDWESFGQTPTFQGLNILGNNVWHSGLTWDQPTLRQNGFISPNEEMQSPQVNLSPGVQELSQLHEASLDLSLYRSSGGDREMANTEEIPGYQPPNKNDPSQTSQPHPVLQPSAQYNPDHPDSSEQLLPGKDKKYVPASTKTTESKNTVSDLSGDTEGSVSTEPTSIATSQVDQNLERPGAIERRNIETVQSRVQNIRVKPLSKFLSSGQQLNQKHLIQQANKQMSNFSHYSTGPTAVSNNRNRWTSQQHPEHRGSNIREEHVPKRMGFSTLKQEQGVHGVQVKSDQPAMIRLTELSPNQQEHQQKLVQSVADKGNSGDQVSPLRNVHQPTGPSHIRVKLAPSLSGRLQTRDEHKPQNFLNPTTQSDTRGTTRRTSYLSVAPQNIPNTPAHIGAYPLNNPNSNQDLSPSAGGAGFTGSHTGPNGSDGSSSDLKINTRSDCGGRYGASVNQGIMRGKWIS